MKYINESLAKQLGISTLQYSRRVAEALDMYNMCLFEADYALTLGDIGHTLDVTLERLFESSFPSYYCTPDKLEAFRATIIMGSGDCEACGGDMEAVDYGSVNQVYQEIIKECAVCGHSQTYSIDKRVSFI